MVEAVKDFTINVVIVWACLLAIFLLSAITVTCFVIPLYNTYKDYRELKSQQKAKDKWWAEFERSKKEVNVTYDCGKEKAQEEKEAGKIPSL